MKICTVEVVLFHAEGQTDRQKEGQPENRRDGRTDRQDEARGRFSLFYERT